MKLVHIKQIRGSKSLYGTFLYVTLFPLIVFGIVIMVYSSYTLAHNIQNEVSESLRNVDVAVLAAYDAGYEGDFNVIIVDKKVEFYKGDVLLSEDYTLIDSIKETTDVEISLFFYDTRVLTTIMDDEGQRFINSGANATILNSVVNGRNSTFFNNVIINNRRYFAHYIPIISKDGKTCLGMVGSATPADGVSAMIIKSVLKNLAIMLVALVITGWFIMFFTSEIILVIKKIMQFLSRISMGDLSTELDPTVTSRSDELGEMGRLTVAVRGSLSRLIERDALTGIYNRRYASKKINDLIDKGISYSVALGDIDWFKKFNDTYGHECGDVVLINVARILNESMRQTGFAARWGGEEFLLVFENLSGMSATVTTEKIADSVRSNLIKYDGKLHTVTMSFGVSEGRPELSAEENINKADERLYEAKEKGRNMVIGDWD